MSQSLLEVREAFAVGVSEEVAALEESWRNIKVLCRRRPRCRRRSRIETRRAHAAQIVVVADRLLLAADLHLFILLVPVLSMNLFELHCDLAELLQTESRQHHLLAIAKVAVEELLHDIHVRDDERVESLEVACRVQLSHQVDLEWRVVDRFAASCILIRFVAAEKANTGKLLSFSNRDNGDLC